jgi:hypothetical protein
MKKLCAGITLRIGSRCQPLTLEQVGRTDGRPTLS